MALEREKESVRPRRERVREADKELSVDDGWDMQPEEPRAERQRVRGASRGRPALRDELGDLNRGGAYAAAEAMALGMDIASRVLRGVVDRAFDEDYSEPGDVVRGLANEADLAAYDLIDEVRRVPRKLDRRFEDGIRSPRADRGERSRRESR